MTPLFRSVRRTLACLLSGFLAAAALALSAPSATAAPPECSDLAPTTRICRTSGHSAITTSPDPALTNRYPGWGYGGLGAGFGAGGWWFTF